MAGERAPESWIGQIVSVSVVDLYGSLTGELVEVDDRGLVLRVTVLEDDRDPSGPKEVEPVLAFHPWTTINKVQIPEAALGDAGP